MTLDATIGLTLGNLSLDVDISATDGELIVVAGPNGAGKTTLLRAIAGLERIDTGGVVIDARTMDDGARSVPPHRRDVGLLPQRNFLLPHLTVLDNVAFGLRHRGYSRSAARSNASRCLDEVGLSNVEAVRPHELSGGQARRTALARALAVRPRVLLLDEPLAGIDASSRNVVRRAIECYDGSGVRIVVAHESVDALALGSRVIVLENGRVLQDASPDDIRFRPLSRYTADFVGVNLLHGVGRGDHISVDDGFDIVCAEPVADGERVAAVIHPHAVALFETLPAGSPRNAWKLRVTSVDRDGNRVRVGLAGPPELVAEVTVPSAQRMALRPGLHLWASVKATEVAVHAE